MDKRQIGAYPNNRCRMSDPSLTYHDLKQPDFKVSTRYFDVEAAPKWGRLGEQDDYFWKTPNEKVNEKLAEHWKEFAPDERRADNWEDHVRKTLTEKFDR